MTAQEFWTWFESVNINYLFLNQVDDPEKDRLLSEFITHLHGHCEKLFFAIGGHPDEVQELIISAEGNVQYFDRVEALVKVAPVIKNWKIIAFKPAMGFEFRIEHRDLVFDTAQVWFVPLFSEERPKQLGLRVGFKNYDESREMDFLGGTLLMLDDGLGEKQAALDIGHLEICRLPEDPEEEGFVAIKELPEFLNLWKRSQ